MRQAPFSDYSSSLLGVLGLTASFNIFCKISRLMFFTEQLALFASAPAVPFFRLHVVVTAPGSTRLYEL